MNVLMNYLVQLTEALFKFCQSHGAVYSVFAKC